MKKLSFEKFESKTLMPKMAKMIKGGGNETGGGTHSGYSYSCDYEQGNQNFLYGTDGTIWRIYVV